MIRSVSVATGGMAIAFGLGGAVLTGAVGTASAAPDDDAQVGRSTAADGHTVRPGRRGSPRSSRPQTIPRAAGSEELNVSLARTSGPRSSGPTAPAPRSAVTTPAPVVAHTAILKPVASAVGSPAARPLPSLAALFNNQTPTLHPIQSAQSPAGVVTGRLNAVDPDSSRLTFTVAEAPASGTATVGADGSWTYTPDRPMAVAGGVVAFRVTVSDAASGFAIHGLAGLLHLLSFGLLGSRGDSSTATVTVTVAPITTGNTAPTGRAEIIGVEPVTGQVSGVVTGRDTDDDRLSYAAPDTTAKGAVSLDTAGGAFTYTPAALARHAAARLGASTADTTDTFTVTISDGRGGTAAVPVTAPVSPANGTPAAGAPSAGTPDPGTGVVTGRVGATDPDGDPLTFATQSTTGKGGVAIDATTGSFSYTPTPTARQNAAAPGATDADRQDSFTVSITDGYGGAATATVAVAIAPAEPTPPAPGQLRPADLAFEGFFRVPTGQLAEGPYATLAYGGAALASRVVDGQRHFLVTGHRYANDPLVELVAPATLGGTPETAPVATLYRYWGDIYGGRKVTAEEPDPAEANANWTEGLLWDDANQRVLWSYGNWYAAQRVNNPVLGATVLGADGSLTVQGPWHTTAESQQTRSFAVFLSRAVSSAVGGATLGLGGKMQSINASASWGPSLHVIGSATGDPGTPIAARPLASHPISPTSRRTPRAADYAVARNPDGSLDSAGTEPAADGVGLWTELDETTGAVFVHAGSSTRSALVYSGGQASGLIWYGPDLEHGVADGRGYNGSGNHAQDYRPVLWFVSEEDLVAAAEGRLAPDRVNPYATVDVITQFPELSFLRGMSAGQPVFAEDEGRLYVPFAGGTSDGHQPYPLIAVFSIAG